MSAVRDATALRNLAGMVARDSGGTARVIASGLIRDAGNVLRTFFNSMSAYALPDMVTGLAASSSPQAITTSAAMANPVGGIVPFTYAWALTLGTGWSIANPAASSTTFTSPDVVPFGFDSAAFTCTITDATGATAEVVVSAEVNNIGGSGGGIIP